MTGNSLQQILERADRLYAAREDIENVRASLNSLQGTLNSPADFELTWRSARALFFLGQEQADAETTRELHTRGVKEAERAARSDPKRVEGHFWLGVNLALLAAVEGFPRSMTHAVKAKRALETAGIIDATYHAGGPMRVLARLQSRLPRWLGGGRARARSNYQRAIIIAPNNTVTRLYYAELLVACGEVEQAHRQLETLLAAPIDLGWAFESERDRRLAREMLETLSR